MWPSSSLGPHVEIASPWITPHSTMLVSHAALSTSPGSRTGGTYGSPHFGKGNVAGSGTAGAPPTVKGRAIRPSLMLPSAVAAATLSTYSPAGRSKFTDVRPSGAYCAAT